MIKGIDCLGAMHFEKALLKAHPKGWCAGIMLRTFGNALPTLERMAASGKFSEITVHLAPFDYDHKYLPNKYEKGVLSDAAKVEKLAQKYSSTNFLISPYCEHNHNAGYMTKLFDKLDNIARTCLLVNSIWKGQEVPGTITEVHLLNSKPVKKPKNAHYQIALDGFGGDGSGDYWDANVQKIMERYPDARQFRWWNFELNGKFGHKDKSELKDRKNWPDEGYLRTGNANLKERVGALTWPDSRLYKIADDHDGAQKKDNKAMCILPVNKTEVKVFDTANNVIDTMSTLGLPPHTGKPKGNRFYSGKFTYQIAEIARKNTGSSLIKIHDGPYTDADLRSGIFR